MYSYNTGNIVGNTGYTNTGYMTDEQAISYLENITKRKFSDEQRKILMHRGGMNISACAGSGKTTILINLHDMAVYVEGRLLKDSTVIMNFKVSVQESYDFVHWLKKCGDFLIKRIKNLSFRKLQ